MVNENKIRQRRNLFVADDKNEMGKLLRRACPAFAGSNLFTVAINRKIQEILADCPPGQVPLIALPG